MKILAIDTSGQQASAAIFDSYIGTVVGDIYLNARTGEKSWTHSEILLPAIDNLFTLTGVAKESIDYIAYTSGPGSFTGLRIGASVALGLARGLKKPSIPVPTLDALAYNTLGANSTGVVVPMMDARREQVYSAVYKLNNNCITRDTDYLALPVEDILNTIKDYKDIYVLGDGACAYRDTIMLAIPHATKLPPNNNRQRASSVALCAFDKISNGFVPPQDVELLYVRAPQAIQDLKNREMKGTS